MRARWSMSPCSAPALKPCFLQRFVQNRDVALAIAENDRVLEICGVADEPAQGFALGRAGRRSDEPWVMVVGRRGGAGDLDPHRIMQKGLGEAGDFRRHGGGEEQRLPGEGHQLADALDVRDEAHVEHAVGFVDHQNLDRR